MIDNLGLPDAVQAELAAIRALPRHQEGPIADTYERLQGIAFLHEARAPRVVSRPYDRLYIALHQAQVLALYNLDHLFARSTKLTKDGNQDVDVISHHLRWCHSILRITLSLASSSASMIKRVSPNILSSSESVALDLSTTALLTLDQHLKPYLRKMESSLSTSIKYGYLLDGLSVLAHTFTSCCQLVYVLKSVTPSAPCEEYLRSDILYEAVHSLDTKNDTYLMQFRLFHQVPEVLAAEAADLLKSATASIRSAHFDEVAYLISLVNLCFSHIQESLWPLNELMYPSEYYRIRAHLGQTSGSHSNTLGLGLLRNDYLDFVQHYTQKFASEKEQLDDCDEQVLVLHQNVYMWRDLHLMLPKSVLGEDVTSLIGSHNAARVAEMMKTALQKQDPLFEEVPRLDTASVEPPPNTEVSAETYIRRITGALTKRTFPDVESRTGFFSPRTGVKS